MVDELSANREAAGVVTWFRAEVRVHAPLWLLEGDASGGCLAKNSNIRNSCWNVLKHDRGDPNGAWISASLAAAWSLRFPRKEIKKAVNKDFEQAKR